MIIHQILFSGYFAKQQFQRFSQMNEFIFIWREVMKYVPVGTSTDKAGKGIKTFPFVYGSIFILLLFISIFCLSAYVFNLILVVNDITIL